MGEKIEFFFFEKKKSLINLTKFSQKSDIMQTPFPVSRVSNTTDGIIVFGHFDTMVSYISEYLEIKYAKNGIWITDFETNSIRISYIDDENNNNNQPYAEFFLLGFEEKDSNDPIVLDAIKYRNQLSYRIASYILSLIDGTPIIINNAPTCQQQSRAVL